MVRPVVRQAMNQPGITMEIKDDGLVSCEQTVEVAVAQTVWVFQVRLQLEQIHDVDETNPEVRKFPAQHRSGRERLFSRNVAGASDYDIWFVTLIVAGLAPDANAFRAMRDRRIHIEILKVHLFVANDHVYVIFAAQTVVRDGQKAVHIRWQVDTCDFGTFIYDHIKETRVLVGKPIVILSPNGRSDQ